MNLGFFLNSAQICKKCTILGNLRTITQDGKKEIRQMTPFFHLRFYLCLWYSFLYLKIVKIHFHGVPLWSVHSGLQNTWILEMKAVRLGFYPDRFSKHKHWGKWKTRFYFFFQVENKFQNFRGNLLV